MVKILIKKPVENSTGFCLEEAVKGGDNGLAAVLGRLIVQKAATFLLDVKAKDHQQSNN